MEISKNACARACVCRFVFTTFMCHNSSFSRAGMLPLSLASCGNAVCVSVCMCVYVCVCFGVCVCALTPHTLCHRELQQFEKARLQMRIADKPSVLHKRPAGIYGCIIV